MAQMPSLVQFLIVVLAAWLARQQDAFIEYFKVENRVLKARLGSRRLIFTDTERRLLALWSAKMPSSAFSPSLSRMAP